MYLTTFLGVAAKNAINNKTSSGEVLNVFTYAVPILISSSRFS